MKTFITSALLFLIVRVADATLVSASRFLSLNVEPGYVATASPTSAFADFDRTLESPVLSPELSSSRISQRSSITPSQLLFRTESQFRIADESPSAFTALSGVQALYSFSQPTRFSLVGFSDADSALVELVFASGNGETLYGFQNHPGGLPRGELFQTSGTLLPGTYVIKGTAGAFGEWSDGGTGRSRPIADKVNLFLFSIEFSNAVPEFGNAIVFLFPATIFLCCFHHVRKILA